MNIDEVESGKGLRFLPSGHWTQDVVDKIKESNSLCEKACKSPDEIFNYPGTKHELQQRRVRARREKHQERIDQIKRSLPNVVVLRRDRKIRFGKVIKFTISEEVLKPWQL